MKKQPMEVLSFRITKEMKEALREMARDRKVRLANIVRWALSEFLGWPWEEKDDDVHSQH